MTCLALRLSAPMQSWGTQSRFTERDTGREPSKSGVVGLLCAAMGIDRGDEEGIASLAQLSMSVRVDRDGVLSRDYQTAGGGKIPGLKKYGVLKSDGKPGETVVSNRYYLADADFLVALEGPKETLDKLDEAIRNPHWPLYLGRKSYVPDPPLTLGVFNKSPDELFRHIPWRMRKRDREAPAKLRGVFECAPNEGAARMDVPLSFVKHDRRFSIRFIETRFIESFPVDDGKEGDDAPDATDSES